MASSHDLGIAPGQVRLLGTRRELLAIISEVKLSPDIARAELVGKCRCRVPNTFLGSNCYSHENGTLIRESFVRATSQKATRPRYVPGSGTRTCCQFCGTRHDNGELFRTASTHRHIRTRRPPSSLEKRCYFGSIHRKHLPHNRSPKVYTTRLHFAPSSSSSLQGRSSISDLTVYLLFCSVHTPRQKR